MKSLKVHFLIVGCILLSLCSSAQRPNPLPRPVPIGTPAAAPVISPNGGTFTSAPTVSISDTTPNPTIYYTTNGTAPTTSSTKFAGAFTVSSTETVEAIAVAPGFIQSAVTTATFTIDPLVAYTISQTVDPFAPFEHQLWEINPSNGDLVQQLWVSLPPDPGTGTYPSVGGMAVE